MVKLRKILVVLILSVLAVVMVLPIVLTVTRSLEPGLVSYSDFFLWKPYYLRLFCNSLLIASVGAVGNVIVSVLAAYVFAKVKFRGSGVLFFVYIVVMMMPFQVTLLPQYIVSRDWGIYDTPAALILTIVNSLKIFRESYLLYGYYPDESVYMLQNYLNNHFAKLNYQNIGAAAVLFAVVVYSIVAVLFALEKKWSDSIW